MKACTCSYHHATLDCRMYYQGDGIELQGMKSEVAQVESENGKSGRELSPWCKGITWDGTSRRQKCTVVEQTGYSGWMKSLLKASST
eukprot:4455883-Amphidinium_carterae.1